MTEITERRLIGVSIYQWTPESVALLEVLQPSFVLLGEMVWDRLDEVVTLCGPGVWIILRDTYQDLGGDNKVNAGILAYPEEWGRMLALRMLLSPWRMHPHVWLYDANEVPINTHEQRVALNRFTVAFNAWVEAGGARHIKLNLGSGQPEGTEEEILLAMEDLREAHDLSGLNGAHLYELLEHRGKWSSFRYRLFPSWWDRSRHLATEMGFDSDISRGWRAQNMTPAEAAGVMQTIADEWDKDGLLGGIWFTGPHLDSRWGSWQGTLEMYEYWGSMSMTPVREGVMVYDPHVVWDRWMKSLGAEGYNSDTALAKLREQYPWLGIPIGMEFKAGPYVFRFFTGGVGYWHSITGAVEAVRRFSELPSVNPSVRGPVFSETVDTENWSTGHVPPRWIVVHSSRGDAATRAIEYRATLEWFQNPSSQASAHTVIGYHIGEHARVVPDDRVAWAAKEHNPYSLNVELVQPRPDQPFSDWQYDELNRLITSWKYKYPTIEQILGHDKTPHGIRTGKTDPGYMFDWKGIRS